MVGMPSLLQVVCVIEIMLKSEVYDLGVRSIACLGKPFTILADPSNAATQYFNLAGFSTVKCRNKFLKCNPLFGRHVITLAVCCDRII